MVLIYPSVSLLFSIRQTVQLRGAAVIKARKLSSAMSAAKAICDHMRDIWFGTPDVSLLPCEPFTEENGVFPKYFQFINAKSFCL